MKSNLPSWKLRSIERDIRDQQQHASAVREMASILQLLAQEAEIEREKSRNSYEKSYDDGRTSYRWDYRYDDNRKSNPQNKTIVELGLEQLTLRLQGAMRRYEQPLPTSMADVTTPMAWADLSLIFAIIFGFYNFLPSPNDANVLDRSLVQFSELNLKHDLHRLLDVSYGFGYTGTPTTDEYVWKHLRDAAAKRVRYRVLSRLHIRNPALRNFPKDHPQEFEAVKKFYRDRDQYYFSYSGNDSLEDIGYLVNRIAREEGNRLQSFLYALSGTLMALFEVERTCEIPLPANMVAFVGALACVLDRQADVAVLFEPFDVPGRKPSLEEQKAEYEARLAEEERKLKAVKRQLAEANKKIEALEGRKAFFLPSVPDDKIIADFNTCYLNPLLQAVEKKSVDGAMQRVEIEGYIHFCRGIVYSYEPLEVDAAYQQLVALLKKVETKKGSLDRRERLLDKEMLAAFSTVLGYYNLYQYLYTAEHAKDRNNDGTFLTWLCDLTIPPGRLRMMASDLNVVAWLSQHLPNKRDIPNWPCSLLGADSSSSSDDRRIAEAIIELETPKLLRFRNSLYALVLSYAPLSKGEEQGQSSQAASGPVIQIKHRHGEGNHYYKLALNDLANGLKSPLELDFAVNNKGEGMKDQKAALEHIRWEESAWINYRPA